MTVRLAGGADMKSVRAQVHYDPTVLQLMTADPGDIVPTAAAKALPKINQMAGVVQYVVNAAADAPAHGEGSLILLHFKALAPNSSTRVSLQLAAVQASGATMPPATQQPLTIVVMP